MQGGQGGFFSLLVEWKCYKNSVIKKIQNYECNGRMKCTKKNDYTKEMKK